jgi:hypothetical protein
MNERLNQLAEQAEPRCYERNIDWMEDYLEKFAELIIRECARVIDRGDGAMSSMAETSWCNICRDDILKHFGVEE